MAETKTWAVLLPIRKQHAANIYAGTKTVELRKTVPHFDPGSYDPAKYPFRVYMYESKADGGAGAGGPVHPGIDRAPQSWRYLGIDACKVLEVAARGSPAE